MKIDSINKKIIFIISILFLIYLPIIFFIYNNTLKNDFYNLKQKYILEQLNEYSYFIEKEYFKDYNKLSAKELFDGGKFSIVDIKNNQFINKNKNLINEIPKIFEELNQKKLCNVLKKSSKESRYFDYFYLKDDKKIEKRAWAKYIDNKDLYLVISVEKKMLKKEYENFILKSSIYKVFTFFIVIIILFYYLKKTFKPVKEMDKALEAFINNNFKDVIYVKSNSNNEIGNLVKQINFLQKKISKVLNVSRKRVILRNIQLRKRLYTYSFSKLPNKASMEKFLNANNSFMSMYIDIQKISELNEVFGYKKVDILISSLIEKLKNFSKDNEFYLFHIQYSEFVLVLNKNIGYFEFAYFVGKLENLMSEKYNVSNDIYLNLDFKIGASYKEKELFLTSKSALLSAKRNGNIKVQVYDKNIDTKRIIKNNIHWQNIISKAILDNKVLPVFQPIFNKNKEIIKYEALMRIVDSNNELITPNKFLEISKKTNQYSILSYYLINEAVKVAIKKQINISINLSFLDLKCEKVMALMEELFSNKNIAKLITFELVESEEFEDYNLLENFINKYKKYGVSFSLDDFGSGYSNFSKIFSMSFDYIKIDGSLVKNIDKSEKDFNFLEKLIKMFSLTQMKIIAEYVHNEQVFALLEKLDIHGYQGFYLSEPIRL
ncbi:EAL domain-containing protein [Malaciobacter canalis]|uniref:bifunctional diguanylate cyclase/phosphodiesterase n=1 Tax=Malaciobacter canalis TaxID=1912871 RepID=UPI00384B3226